MNIELYIWKQALYHIKLYGHWDMTESRRLVPLQGGL